LAEDEFPLTETEEPVFNNNPDKLLCAGGAHDFKSSPRGSRILTKSRQSFSGNNINVAAALFFYKHS